MYNTLDVLSTAREEEESNIDKEIVSHNTQSPFEEPKETLQLKTKNEPAISDEILAQLVAMGFELSLAQIAVNENKGCGFDATLQWLLQQQSYQNDNGHDEEIKVPIKHSTENFYSKNVESNPALKIKLTPYRRPISTANATPPKKGILKPPPPPNTRSLWKRDWLSTLNIRLQNAANSASTTAAPNTTASFFSSALKRLNSPTTFSYITQQEELQQMPQQNQKQPPHVNPTTPADQIPQYNSQNFSPSSNTNLLTPKALKRVRFSVAKLTDEYPHSPIPGESDNSDWEDEYDFREWNEKQKKTSQTLPEAEQKRVYTPRDMMKFYLAACRNREEFPADRLVDIFKKACQPGGSLNVIDLTGDIIDKKIAEPIADILTLEFGLQKLIMERCEIEEDTMKIICHSLLVNDSLPYLNLSNNKRLRTNGFNYIAVYIKKSLTLAYLDLSGINIDKKSATFLAQALIQGNNKSGAVLETLNLDNCGLKNNVLEVLGPGIRRSNLRNLSLRFNRINHVGAVWIGVMLRDYEDLNFGTNNAQLSPSMPPFNEQEEARAEKLRSRKRGIEVLNITGNDLRSGIQYIAQALRRNRSLKELHMQENRIDPKGLAILADGLKYNHTLELLNISKNPVGGPSSEGIIAIRNGLSLNTTLKGLFLSNINLSSEGAIAIAEYLPETNSLVHLDLTSNPDIDIAGVLALAVSIKMNHSVRVLDVNVQPNDNEMARLSRDILRACVRNTELAQKSDSENSENGFLLADFETKSHSVLSGITGSSDFDESSELSLGIYVEDLKKNVKVGKENLKAFEELLATDEKISFTEKVEANEMINQLHDQCKNIQAKIRPYIAAVTDESLLEELLTLNDNLSNAFQKYEKIYNNHEIFQNPKPITSVADITTESNDDDHDNIITTIETSPITIVTSPTSPSVTSPTFSIGDSDDDSDFDNIALSEGSLSSKKIPPSLKIESLLASDIDIHSQKSPKSPLEEMNKLLEVEEGQVLRKAREVFDQDIEETESSPLDQLSGEELKLQLLDEPNLS